jgi:protoporphyrinogen oxidase
VNNIMVVGSGIAGLLAAKVLASENNVYLLDRAHVLGGLLRSESMDGITFDMGTHILRESPRKEVNDLVFGGLDLQEWTAFGNLKVGNYFAGDLYKFSQAIDIRNLPEDEYNKVVVEVIQRLHKERDTANAKAYLVSMLGPYFYLAYLQPLLHKFYGIDGSELSWDSALILGLGRVIGFDGNISEEIKRLPGLDERFAFNSYEQGISAYRNYYPKKGGIGKWVDHIESELETAGVTMLKGSEIQGLAFRDRAINKAHIKGHGEIAIDRLVWTIPPIFLLKLLGKEVKSPPPRFRQAWLFNFMFKDSFLTDNHYIHCYDDKMDSFRVTLYPNLRDSEDPCCTVEVIMPGEFDEAVMKKEIHDELIVMGIVEASNEVVADNIYKVGEGFPMLTNDFKEANAEIVRELDETCSNLTILGRASGKAFFMGDIIEDIVDTLM